VSSVDSKSWVRSAQHGDVAAFERLYEAYVNRTYALCLRMTGNRSDAEDCTQNAFISAWRKLGRRRGGAEDELDDAHAASEQHPDAGLDLEAAIASLPAQARHVFVLRAIYGYSHEEVAATLEIAPGTARAHYFRARDALKRALDSENDDE
jgi:RNA polymerase sigma-70 factor (ECF subfamily)